MLVWQKRARALALVVAIGVVAAVFATTRRREEAPPPASVARVDPSAIVESSGAFLLQHKGERETVRIAAERQLSYADGSTRLLNVTVTSMRQGKIFVATGDEARVGENQSNIDMKGHVKMKASDGLAVSANSATYSQTEGMIRAPGPVAFTRGRLSGTGVDFTYNERDDLMGLSDQTRVTIAGETAGAAETRISSRAAVLARRDKFVSFEREVHIEKGSQIIDSNSALGTLTDDQEHLSGLELQGGARIETPNAGAGDLKQMSGNLINLTYYENSNLLQGAIVAGSGAIRIAGEPGAAESMLHAQNVEMAMAPDGTTLTSLNAREAVVLDLAAPKGQPAKKISATTLVASGDATKGLTAATFGERIEYSEIGGTPPIKRTVTSRTLDTALGGGLTEIREATFLGSVRLRDAATAANSSRMRYQLQTGQVELTGAPGEPLPRVENDDIMIDATRVEMNIEGSKLKATGEPKKLVASVMQPHKPGDKGTRRTPGLMRQDQPVSGLSRELVYTGGDDSSAEFIGAVTLVQGEKIDTKIQAEKILINTQSGNLTAQGSVLSLMNVQEVNPTTKVKEVSKSTGQGQQMVYDDALHKVTYSTKARLLGPNGDLTAESIILTLGANGQDVERLDASGEVRLQEVDRLTTGDVMTYVAEGEEYNMMGKGKLVRMLRTTTDGCRKSEGQQLTFSRSTDTLRIEGREETRTQTSSDSSCTAAPKR